MGQGEYGGNGSVHYYATFRRDRNNGHGNPHLYAEVDEYPSQANGGNFTVTIFGLPPGTHYVVAPNGRLVVEVAIAHDENHYTEQVRVEWPNP